MKITIYDLLGLVREDKAPKKIKCYDEIFKLNEVASIMPDIYTMDNLYVDSEGYRLFCEYNWQLNDEVEIIEEEKDIEELDIQTNNGGALCLRNEEGTLCGMNKHSIVMAKKINEIVKAVNELKKDN